MGKIPAELKGAALTAPMPSSGDPGRNGARCAATPIGPTPGPPPPCGRHWQYENYKMGFVAFPLV